MSEDDKLETERFGCAIITQEEKMISYYCSDPTVGFICDINGQKISNIEFLCFCIIKSAVLLFAFDSKAVMLQTQI